jgi:hypothetical protein
MQATVDLHMFFGLPLLGSAVRSQGKNPLAILKNTF